MILFLVRHGQSVANVTKIYSGQNDVPLTEVGKEQAMALRPVLSDITFDRVYSSDLSRAIDTQRLALPGVEGIRTPLLREIDVGRAAGYPWGKIPNPPEGWSSKNDHDAYARVGGESMADMCNRIREFLQILEKDPCDKAIAFVHNGVMNAMMRIVLGTDVEKGALFSENCAIHAFEYNGTQWRLLAWNYMRQL